MSTRPTWSTGIDDDGAVTFGRTPDGGVLDRAEHDRTGAVSLPRRPVRPVRRFRAAGGEDHLSRAHPDEVGDGLARLLDGGGDDAPFLVGTPRVGVDAPVEPGGDGPGGFWPQRTGRGVVEVVPGHVAAHPATLEQDRSPRARDESRTGTSSPQSPASSPFTIPRSTAQSTGCSRTTSPNGQCSRTTQVVALSLSAWAANPWAVERVDDGRHRDADRALRLAGRHLGGEGAPVLLADLLGEVIGDGGLECGERPHEQVDDELVRTGRDRHGRRA